MLNDEMAKHITMLWKDSLIQAVFDNRSQYNIEESTGYFFDKIEKVAQQSFMPNGKTSFLVHFVKCGNYLLPNVRMMYR